MAGKRADYFQAGTSVAWHVDPRTERVHACRADAAVTFDEGQEADAEPAVPGWRMSAEDIFARPGPTAKELIRLTARAARPVLPSSHPGCGREARRW